MSLYVTVRAIYAADRSSSTFGRVPILSTIGEVKDLIMHTNQMESATSINIVQRGRIFGNDDVIGMMNVSENATLVVYVTGIPSKVFEEPEQVPIKLRSPLKMKVRALVDFGKKSGPLFGLIGVLGLAVLMAYSSLQPDPIAESILAPDIIWSKEKVIVMVSILTLVAGLGMYVGNVGPYQIIWTCKLFVVSLLPTFDFDEWQREHGVTA